MSSLDPSSKPARGRRNDPSSWEEELDAEDVPADAVESEEPGPRWPRRSAAVKVLYHDEEIIVAGKPPGIWIEHEIEDEPSVFEQLEAKGLIRSDAPAWHAVYPLDVGASGLVVLAGSFASMNLLREQMGDGTLDLCCLALVRGHLAQETGTIDRPIVAAGGDRPARIDDAHGQKAVTEWRLRDSFVGFALLECRPRTAVISQLRVHLSSAGMPLVVDPAFGGGESLMLSSFKSNYRPSRRHAERPLIQRLTLHAFSVRFPHPKTKAPMQLELPPPKDFRAALNQLDHYGRLPPPP